MATPAEIARAYRLARERWGRIEASTVNRLRRSYRRATDALAAEVARLPAGSVSQQHLTRLVVDLDAATEALSIDTMAALQRGILTGIEQATLDAWNANASLTPLIGGSARLQARLQGTAEAQALAWVNRVGSDGLQLSDRVWRANRQVQGALRRILEDAVITGKSARDTAQELQHYVRHDRVSQRQETAQRLGIPMRIDYRAVRLARTEINQAGREATVMVHRGQPFYRGVQWVRSNMPYRCVICEGLASTGWEEWVSPTGDGFYPRDQEPLASASHPNCRCTLLPIFEDPDEVTARLGDWLEDPASEPELEAYFGAGL